MEKHESTPDTWIVNYESKPEATNSKRSGYFSLKIRRAERTLIRNPNGRETLLKQSKIDVEDPIVAIDFKTPPAFLGEEKTCNKYVANLLSKAKINGWIQKHVVPNISKDAVNMNRLRREEGGGFIVVAEAEIVKETSINGWTCVDDYDSEGRRIPIEQDCAICLEELSTSSGEKKKIMRLPCLHNFHRECVLSWLRRKHSCPCCRDDINNPRP